MDAYEIDRAFARAIDPAIAGRRARRHQPETGNGRLHDRSAQHAHNDWFDEYVANVPAIIRSYGGDYVGVDGSVKKLEGMIPVPERVAIFSFPSTKHIEECMVSEAYAPYLEAGKRASEAGSSSSTRNDDRARGSAGAGAPCWRCGASASPGRSG